MSTNTVRSYRLIQIITTSLNMIVICAGYAAAQSGAPIPATAPFASPDIKPTLADWLTARPLALAKKIALTDPLLKPPFAGASADSLKGMAAGIRAVQLDIPNRVKACRYLGTVDCVTYPQAQDMLIATMQEDPSEAVRYEAVMALRNMLTRGCCNMSTMCECDTCCNRKKIVRETENHARQGQRALIKEAKGHAKILAIKVSRQAEDERYDCCRGCANEKVMKALAKVAFEKDDQCCWVEPSERVRNAASEAMCLFRTYPDGYGLPDFQPEPVPPVEEKEVEPMNDGESIPESTPEIKSNSEEVKPAPKPNADTSAAKPILRTVAPQIVQLQTAPVETAPSATEPVLPELKSLPEVPGLPTISGLRGRCIVALKSRQVLPADPKFSSVYEEHTYYFSSIDAKAAFDQDPKKYAPAYGGMDPVTWLAQRQMENGQFLREFDGQFFLFVSKENWETFKSNPNRYVLRRDETNLRTVSGTE